jgi:hypothetical protein
MLNEAGAEAPLPLGEEPCVLLQKPIRERRPGQRYSILRPTRLDALAKAPLERVPLRTAIR